jgi:Na+-translocating ferredoxin:NAD+ oxidoreductase RnfD subunit
MFQFKLKWESIKTQLIIYLVCFAIFLSIKEKDAAFLVTTIIAVISSLAVQSIILYLKTKNFQITESPIITGLIVGYVLSSDEAWWKFIVASSLAILSKYLIRFRDRHIFNPAGFGVLLTLIFFNAPTQWKGTYVWYILLPFGLYFVYKIRKTEIIIGYAIVFLALLGVEAALQKVSFWHIFGYLSYFYIFVMVIEPKTTPIKPIGKFLFGAGIAALMFILNVCGVAFGVELFSLLAMNIAVPMLNKIPYKKGGVA